ncbi:Type IV leader peptidase family protein [Aquimixticola soesokkakensis]|uniref:Type IV leader peptidase family protein n=1 Tax=Aquimixticola soesokkakensis TaxID=1519096 RepID=A0A1Y5S715_9RHOB|nr:prepilin peptidase [Aquimixticola soesokkakensis]SLN32675.1 Type IV leader peptidase family protein [Aquimixticola soesokkakensis]
MLALPASAALWFLPFAIVIGLWVAFNDMRAMKIPNLAVGALLVVYVVIGLIALPLDQYLWGYLHFVVVLAIGFVLNMARALGAGDAKFAAAMAPMVPMIDLPAVAVLFAACLLAAFATHRLARAIPIVRRVTPEWASWTHGKFPMGLALGPTLIFYLLLASFIGAPTP